MRDFHPARHFSKMLDPISHEIDYETGTHNSQKLLITKCAAQHLKTGGAFQKSA